MGAILLQVSGKAVIMGATSLQANGKTVIMSVTLLQASGKAVIMGATSLRANGKAVIVLRARCLWGPQRRSGEPSPGWFPLSVCSPFRGDASRPIYRRVALPPCTPYRL